MTIEEFLAKYRLLNRKDVLDESTWIDASHKARFIDPELGEYWTLPRDVLHGSVQGHPKRRWQRAAQTRKQNRIAKDKA
jgi:hypothetical protein